MKYFVEGMTNLQGDAGDIRHIGEYATLEDAIKAAEQVIDEFLIARLQDGMTVADLFAQYHKFGEIPFIFSDDARTMNVRGFNHLNYAISRCSELCMRDSVPQ